MSAIEQDEPTTAQSDSERDDPYLGELERLKKDIKEAQRARSKWREEAAMCYDYVAGHQWSPEDKAILDEQHRPAIVFNRTDPLIKAVCGLEVNNRQSVIYLPRTQGDVGIEETITAAGKWVRDECNAEDEESEAFRDMAICGEGWTETRMDYDDDPIGQIVKERIDPLEMGVIKGASRANYADARMVYRIRDMDAEDVRALLGLDESIIDAALDAKWLDDVVPADGGKGNKQDYPDETRAGVRERGGRRTTVKVIQCQYWRREPVNLVATADDQEPMHLNDEDFAKFKERADAMNAAAQTDPTGQSPTFEYTSARSVKKVFYECFIGSRILDLRKMQMECFQFSAMTAQRDRKDKCFYGMVRGMIDPQNWSNKFLSQTMHHINVNAKGGLLAETDAFTDIKKAERDWSDPTKIVFVKPGSLQKQKIKERTAIALPPGLDQLMMFAVSSIRDVTGINLELLGQADREQAASLEQQRRQSAMTILATMFDSLRKYRKRDGRLLLKFIWLLPEGTLIRVLDQGQYKYIPLIKEGNGVERYDTIIDQAPTSPDQKQFVWAVTAQILQMNILPPPAIIALLKYSPYPESVVQEIQKALGIGGDLPPDQLKQKLDQAEQALQVMEEKLKEEMEKNKDKQDENAIALMREQIGEYKAETERLAAMWKARVDMASAIADAQATPDPSESGGGSSSAPAPSPMPTPTAQGGGALEQKVDQLTALVTQLVQSLSGQAQPAEPDLDDGMPVGDQ